eukprot:11751896-Prorocentrum_lima.AAC.1
MESVTLSPGVPCAACEITVRLSNSMSLKGGFYFDEPCSSVYTFVRASGKVRGTFRLLFPGAVGEGRVFPEVDHD